MKYRYLIVLLLIGLIINENVVRWALAVSAGKHGAGPGFKDAFEQFTIPGYLFFTALRLVPFVGLGLILDKLSKTKLKSYVIPVLIGGLSGIFAMFFWGFKMALDPYFLNGHTSAATLLLVPIYAFPAGVIGASLLTGIYIPIRNLLRKKNTEPADAP